MDRVMIQSLHISMVFNFRPNKTRLSLIPECHIYIE
jgi:hypothetical protein